MACLTFERGLCEAHFCRPRHLVRVPPNPWGLSPHVCLNHPKPDQPLAWGGVHTGCHAGPPFSRCSLHTLTYGGRKRKAGSSRNMIGSFCPSSKGVKASHTSSISDRLYQPCHKLETHSCKEHFLQFKLKKKKKLLYQIRTERSKQ